MGRHLRPDQGLAQRVAVRVGRTLQVLLPLSHDVVDRHAPDQGTVNVCRVLPESGRDALVGLHLGLKGEHAQHGMQRSVQRPFEGAARPA